jgi:hypothetical protein
VLLSKGIMEQLPQGDKLARLDALSPMSSGKDGHEIFYCVLPQLAPVCERGVNNATTLEQTICAAVAEQIGTTLPSYRDERMFVVFGFKEAKWLKLSARLD